MTTQSLKEEVKRVIDELPDERLVEILDFALFIKGRAQQAVLQRELIRPEPVPRSDLMALSGIVSWGGNAVEDTEQLYDGSD